MKSEIKKPLAILAAVAVLGWAVGSVAYVNAPQGWSENFGFRGVYPLAAFADEVNNGTDKITVVGGSGNCEVDITVTKSLTSTDGNYKLFVTAFDVGDLYDVSYEVSIGYEYDGTGYNGANGSGLTNVYYTSLTVRTSDEGTVTLSMDDMFHSAIADFSQTGLIVAEVKAAEGVDTATPLIEQTKAVLSASNQGMYPEFIKNIASEEYCDLQEFLIGNVRYYEPLKMQASTKITLELKRNSKITFCVSGMGSGVKLTDEYGTTTTCCAPTDGYVFTTGLLPAGTYTVSRADSTNLCYISVN